MLSNSQVRTIIREEVIHIIEDMTNSHSMDTVAQTPSALADIPGVPFGGRLFYTGAIINNEARSLLIKWLKFAVLAKRKFGDPQSWPDNVVQASKKLAGNYENKATERGFSSTYRQF
jgi:hypothetical protein